MGRGARLILFLNLLPLLVGCAGADDPEVPRGLPASARAAWVVRTGLSSDDQVARIVAQASTAGFDSLMVQVRGRGDAWFQGGIEPPPPRLVETRFDPLARILEMARPGGIGIHAWINANLVWNPEDPNPDPRHVVHRHPDWLMVPEDLAPALLAMEPTEPAFKEGLEAYASAHRDDVEGVYGDPAHPEYRDHVASVVKDLVARYAIQGIHLDYIRYPARGFGASRHSLRLFRAEVDEELTAADREDMASRVEQNPLVYARRYPRRWEDFRRRAVSAMVERIADAARRARPGVVISAAVLPDIEEARNRYFQDWPDWLRQHWLDLACPMNYASAGERDLFEQRTLLALNRRGRGRVWMGIGAWRLDIQETVSRARFALSAGADGVIFFSHEGLAGQPDAFTTLRRELERPRVDPDPDPRP
jgi:uncharacterized lipoprotein YddW (UPF0748 family)